MADSPKTLEKKSVGAVRVLPASKSLLPCRSKKVAEAEMLPVLSALMNDVWMVEASASCSGK